MTADGTSEERGNGTNRMILVLQYCLPISFTIAMAGLITWIVRLILLARDLQDVPSASVGISIVAVPIFLILLSVFWYVFLGIVRNRNVPQEAGGSPGPSPLEGVDA